MDSGLKITIGRDYVALAAYKVALEKIIQEAEESPFTFTSADAVDIAETTLRLFPMLREG